MAKKSLEQVIEENLQLGFEPDIIKIAYNNVNGDADRVIDEIFRLQQQSTIYPTKPSNPQDQDAQLSKAIELSIGQAKDRKIPLEPLNPQQRIRKAGVPVGLKNIGNTCYFNSILQTYFQNIEFAKAVLSYSAPHKYRQLSDVEQQKATQDQQFKRKQASCKLVENLKILFASMIASDRKYVDPTDVISSIVDDDGIELQIGDQKDIGEFNLVFLSRIDEGFRLQREETEMKDENEQNKQNFQDSPSKIAVLGNQNQDMKMSMSMIRHSSIKIQHNSLIQKQFIGNMVNFYTNQKQNIHQEEEEQFSLLFVNVSNKELYNAIQHITIQHIDDYRNEKGEVVGVEKQSWIKTPPKTLFFQIDRVTFDKETCQLKKINDEFEFPNVFYIDPFLLKNREEALKIQIKVRKLREQRQKYTEALKKMQKFGQKNLNLLDMLTQTTDFLAQQKSVKADNQLDNPIIFPQLKDNVKDEHINLLKKYSVAIDQRITNYHKKITEIDNQIQKCYESLRSKPYHLYSILIHEGSADSGHYYSYIYEIQTKKWRKYNDINISEEAEPQIIKEAKGINFTSAYYLVYAQQQVISESQSKKELRNYEVSTNENYLKDYYSQLMSKQLTNRIKTENQQLYYEIQQFQMGGLANRVVDAYTKNFQMCNQAYRKLQSDKDKNIKNPPVLTNFPLYLKQLNKNELYKSALIENVINEYGPKQYDPVFDDILKKKLNNFNEFKKPKELKFDHIHAEQFMENIIKAQAFEKLFISMKKQEYKGLLSLLMEIQKGDTSNYFGWLSGIFCKVMIVLLLSQAQALVKEKNYEKSVSFLRYALNLCCKFIKRDQEKILINNCFFWMSEIAIDAGQKKQEVEELAEKAKQGNYEENNQEFLKEAYSEDSIKEIRDSTDINNSMWNLSRHENTLIKKMLDARQQIKVKMQSANNLYREMKKYQVPLKMEQRQKILDKK